jgi:hypothetical protein
VLPAVRYYFYLLRPLRDFRNTVCSSCWPSAAQIICKKHRKLLIFDKKQSKTSKTTTFSPKIPLNVLPAVRTSFNHSGTSCLHDSMMLLLASGSTNNWQNNSQKRSLSKTKMKYFQNFYLLP